MHSVRQIADHILCLREDPFGRNVECCPPFSSGYLQDSLLSKLVHEVLHKHDWRATQKSSTQYPASCPSGLFTQEPAFPWTPQLHNKHENIQKPFTTRETQLVLKTQMIAGGASGHAMQAARQLRKHNDIVQEYDAAGCIPFPKRARLLDAVQLIDEVTECQPERNSLVHTVLQQKNLEETSAAGEHEQVEQALRHPAPTNTDNAAANLQLPLQPAVNTLAWKDREVWITVLNKMEEDSHLDVDVLLKIGVSTIEDDMLLTIVKEAVVPASTYVRCRLVASTILLPRLEALDCSPSRALVAAVEHLGVVNPQVLLQHCVQSVLRTSSLNQHQAELLNRAVRDWIPASLLSDLLEMACGQDSSSSSAAPGKLGQHWNEQLVGLIQTIMGAKPQLSQAALKKLVGALQGAATSTELQTSVKFVKLALTIVKHQGKALQPYAVQMKTALAGTRTFMTKSVVAAISRL